MTLKAVLRLFTKPSKINPHTNTGYAGKTGNRKISRKGAKTPRLNYGI
jgi:hypothetical protein